MRSRPSLAPNGGLTFNPLHNRSKQAPDKPVTTEFKPSETKLSFGRLEKDYIIHREVARGGYGVVYLATSVKTNSVVAIKVFLPHHRQLHSLQEVLYMMLLRDKSCFPRIKELEITETNVMVVMEWVQTTCPHPELLLRGSFEAVMRYMASLCRAVDGLHQMGIIHHDIKPSNFIFDPTTNQGVLLDFGTMLMDEKLLPDNHPNTSEMSAQQRERRNSIIKNQRKLSPIFAAFSHLGTEVYSAPEKYNPSLVDYEIESVYFSKQVDIWSIGCILAEFMFMIVPFFSVSPLVGQTKSGEDIEIKDRFASTLLKLATLFGAKWLRTQIEPFSNVHVRLPANLPEEPIKFEGLIRWTNLEPTQISRLTSILKSCLRLQPHQRPSASTLAAECDSLSHLRPE